MGSSSDRPDVVVVGAGVIGLSCAWRLVERGHTVALWSRDDPADTVSAVAGAIWYPYLAEPRARVLGWSRATWRRLAGFANDPASGVRMCPVIEVFDRAPPDVWWRDAVPRVEPLAAGDVPPPYAAAIRVDVPVCDVPVHLPWLVAGLARRGVRLERRSVRDLEEAFAVADTVVNCTGLGAAALCGDPELRPVRGQVVVVEAAGPDHAWIDDTAATPGYVIPRGRDVVLGGTAQPGDRRLAPDPADTAAILAGVARRFPGLASAPVRAVRVGLRPYRSTVRLELERLAGGRRLVHDYGHGGSGYTLAWGCADEVAALVAG